MLQKLYETQVEHCGQSTCLEVISQQVRKYKRNNAGNWEAGKVFEGIYQPGMIFLDNNQHLNVVVNSETEPVKHYRSIDKKNLNNFKLIASGNELDDGLSWYVGVGELFAIVTEGGWSSENQILLKNLLTIAINNDNLFKFNTGY